MYTAQIGAHTLELEADSLEEAGRLAAQRVKPRDGFPVFDEENVRHAFDSNGRLVVPVVEAKPVLVKVPVVQRIKRRWFGRKGRNGSRQSGRIHGPGQRCEPASQ